MVLCAPRLALGGFKGMVIPVAKNPNSVSSRGTTVLHRMQDTHLDVGELVGDCNLL